MFDDLRQLAYPETTRSKYEGVPEMTRAEKEAFDKDEDTELWERSKRYTNQLFRRRINR